MTDQHPEDGVPEGNTPGTAIATTAPGMSGVMPSPFGGLGAAPARDVLKGGMDRSGLLNALRRRWAVTAFLSVLLGALAGGGLFLLFPETFAAKATYRVASNPLSLVENNRNGETTDFDIFRSTQIAYIKSPFVLSAALNKPGIAQLPMFPKDDDKIEWLREQLSVAFPNDGELLEIGMSGPYPRGDLKRVVEAVSQAYYDEVVFRERGRKSRPLQILQKSFASIDDDIRDELVAYQQLAKDTGTSEAYTDGFDPETKLMLTEVSQLSGRQADLQSQLMRATMGYQIFERQINDPSYQDSLIDEALAGDPNIAQMQSEVMLLDSQIRNLQSTIKRGASPAVRRLVRQRDQINQQIAAMREQMRAQIAGEASNEPNPYLKAETTSYQITQATLGQELQRTEQKLTQLQEELIQKAENNTDLMIRRAKIEQLRAFQTNIATRVRNLQVERDAPERITAIGSDQTGAAVAETSNARNLLVRALISALGGLGTMALTCLGIGFMEFNQRRLDGPEQVDEGLGIRVIGTLPSLSGKKAMNPRHPVVAQLSESIDSVRTALMHESTKKPRRLVMVTSAETSEGRTTVASQLAASLARAGRRTLLVDGDLRRPVLHTLFNQPLEDGLSEVLRAEADPTDTIRPTQTEGLWVMTAGYCDIDAVRALATDQAEPIFKQLRDGYDFVIIDGPPVLGLSDSLLFGQQCDGVILSVLRDFSNVPKVNKAAEELRAVGIRLVGAVVNGVKSKADRRVTHLQQVEPKNKPKQLETAEV